MKDFSSISEKGQVTLPIKMRSALNLKPGMKVQITLSGSTVRIEAAPDINQLRQENTVHLKSLKKRSKKILLAEEKEAGKKGAIARFKRSQG